MITLSFKVAKRAVIGTLIVGGLVVAYELGKVSGYIHLGMDILNRLDKPEEN